MSRRTRALRPELPLAEADVARVRRRRRRGDSPQVIARATGLNVRLVKAALLAMRTPKVERSRASLNVSLDDHAWVLAERRPGEAVWQTVARLVAELKAARDGKG